MLEKTRILLQLFEHVQKIYGRKKLQKMVHLLQYSGSDFNMKYSYYHYGPYSSELQRELEELVDNKYILEEKVGEGYEYSLTNEGRIFLNLIRKNIGKRDSNLSKDKIDILNQQCSQFLEVLSTYVFLIDNGYTNYEAYEKTKELKPHLIDRYLEDVKDFYKKYFS